MMSYTVTQQEEMPRGLLEEDLMRIRPLLGKNLVDYDKNDWYEPVKLQDE